jgi:hypothetical protein
MEPSEALAWRKSKPDFVKSKDISMDIYGKIKVFKMPVEYKESANIKKVDDITVEFKKYILKFCSMRLMSD